MERKRKEKLKTLERGMTQGKIIEKNTINEKTTEKESTIKVREYQVDTIKGILILMVVLGHLLELDLTLPWSRSLHCFIYMIHMPAFVFTTGYFSKFSLSGIIRNLLYPYVLFQFLYLLFYNCLCQKEVEYRFLTPYWLMWYLLAAVIWSLCLKLLENCHSGREKGMFLVLLFGIALGAGYVEQIGRWFALSRVCVFAPFFFLGYFVKSGKERKDERYLKDGINAKEETQFQKKINFQEKTGFQKRSGFCQEVYKGRIIITGIMLLFLLFIVVVKGEAISREWLYEAVSYERAHYGIGFRIVHLLFGLVGISSFFLLVPKRKLPLLSRLGKHTLSIYLIHGFFIRILAKYRILQGIWENRFFTEMPWLWMIFLLGLAVLIAWLLSTPPVVKIMQIILFKKKRTL